MRVIVLILVCVVIFLAGLLYGMNYDSQANEMQQSENTPINQTVEQEETDVIQTIAPNNQNADTPAYAVASALEEVFKFIAEIIVELLFRFSSLFY